MICIGGSLGSMAALRAILQPLPITFPLPIAVVVHRHRDSDDALVPLLQRDIVLPVREILDKDPITPGQVHIAPSDYHLLIESDYFSLSTDEPVQFARPSIDVFLESAADILGNNAIGVILTGANHDGANGARELHRRGGTLIVQDPASAESPIMPQSALGAVPGAIVREPDEIGRLLIKLATNYLLKS